MVFMQRADLVFTGALWATGDELPMKLVVKAFDDDIVLIAETNTRAMEESRNMVRW